jgi:parvulin-like peptidyl-prolyl isomerase
VTRRLAAGLLLLLLIAVFGSVQGCEEELPEGAIAQVGQSLVSQAQLDKLEAAYTLAGLAPDEEEQPSEYLAYKQQLVEYLVTLEIMRQEATTYSVTVTSDDVDARLQQIKQFFLGDEDKFEAALDELNLTLEQLTQSIRESLWFEEMEAAVTEDVTVSEEEVQAYYEAHKTEYVAQESRTVRHILISPFVDAAGNMVTSTPTQDDWDAAKAEAEQVRSDILNGADFVTEVEEYSDDVLSIVDGGKLGEVIKGQTTPAFEEAVFSLQKEELSEPVKTSSGYHIIEVTDITPEAQLSYDLVKEKIRTTLLTAKQTEVWDRWLSEKQAELGVVYRDGYAPVSAVTTSLGAGTTTTPSDEGASDEESTSDEETTTTSAE